MAPRESTGRPARRTVLVAALTLGATSACGIRLESDLPNPLDLFREDPAVAPLSAEIERVRAATATAGTTAGDQARALGRLHAGQLTALLTDLRERGTDHTPPPTPTPPRGATPASDTTPLLAAEAAALDPAGRQALAQSPADAAQLLLASHAQRGVAYTLLGGRLGGWPPTVLPPVAGQAVADALHAAMYGLEIVAARADAARRPAVLAALGAVRIERALVDEHTPPASPPPFGYTLPFDLDEPQALTRLADTVLDALVGVLLAQAPHVVDLPPVTPSSAASPAPPTPGAAAVTAGTGGGAVDAAPMSTLLRLAITMDAHRRACGGALRLLPPLRPAGPASATPTPAASPTSLR